MEAIGARACALSATDNDLRKLRHHLKDLEAAFDTNDIVDVLRATTEFYETLFKSGGKTVAWTIIQQLNARINSLRSMTFMSPGRAKKFLNEMHNILSAVEARNASEAEQACVAHVKKAHRVALAVFDARNESPAPRARL